jgi:cell wall assembly regulator SMI1
MEEIWTQIDAWLEANAPVVSQSLQPGASDSQIQALEDTLSIYLPEDVRASYRIHNGQSTVDYGAHGLIPLVREFLCLERIQDEWQVKKEVFNPEAFPDLESEPAPGIKTDFWNLQWIPLTSDGGGDNHCLDLDPAEGGTSGQIITMVQQDTRREVVATSFRNWLEEYAKKLESGEYVFSKEYDGIVTLAFFQEQQAERERERNLPRFIPTETVVTAKSITIGIYDGDQRFADRAPGDKDEVTLALNGEIIFQHILLDSTTQFYDIELAPGMNTITVTAVRLNPIRLVMPFITIDENLVYRGESQYHFGFVNENFLSSSFTISYLLDD